MLLAIFANNILPIFLVAAVGFLLSRYLHVDVKTLSRLALYVLAPCLVLDLLITSPISPGEFGQMVAFTICSILGIGLITFLVALPLRLERPVALAFLIAVMFANGGNYGLPLVSVAFGEQALARATIFFVVSAVLTYTVGVILASSGRQSIWAALIGVAKIPIVYAVIAAAIILVTKITLPAPIMRPLQLLSDASIPVMILVLGMQLEQAIMPEKPLLVGLAVVLRLVVATALAILLAGPFKLSGAGRQAGILESAMPTAVTTTILAVEFDVAPSLVTSIVFVSTLVSPLTLTALIALLQ